jgi:hypothetical protein
VSITSGGPFGQIEPALRILGLAADQGLEIRGIDFISFVFTTDDLRVVTIDDCEGAVLLEDCAISPSFLYSYPVEIDQCDSVTLARCSVRANLTFVSTALGFLQGPVPYTALSARDSNLFAYESEFQGSRGAPPFELCDQLFPAPEPGYGIRLTDSTMLAVGCTITGGDEQSASSPLLCAPGGDGIEGLTLNAFGPTPSSATLLDCAIAGGLGAPGTCGQPDGSDAAAIDDLLGGITDWPGVARTGVVDALMIEGGTATVSMTGQPGDFGVLLWSPNLAPGVSWLPEPTVIHVGLPLGSAVLGPLPASGTFTGSFTMPLPPPGVLSRTLVVQTVQIGPPLATYEGGPSLLTILDASL